MNFVRAGIVMLAALLVYGAPRHKAEASVESAGGHMDEIASAREALRQASFTLGEDHPITAFMLRNLALAMEEGGYPNYADHYAQQSLAILERHFGPNDVSLVPALNVLAETAVMQSRYGDARKFARRAVDIGPDAGAHYATALHNLAAAYHAEGKFQDAAEYYRQALAIREKLLPPGHPYIRLTRAALNQVRRSAKMIAHR
jgi:tetratricopeptide (TPR) repeat protein